MGTVDGLRVLIVEMTWPLGFLLAAALDDEGMQVDIVEAGPEAMPRKRSFEPDVVVLGLGGSPPDFLRLVETFAAEGDCGIVVVSGEDLEDIHVASLDRGADDYIVEPVALRRVAARLRAVHRRLSRAKQVAVGPRVRVDASKRGLVGPGSVMSTLTEAEFALLRALLDGEGGAVSRESLGQIALKRMLHADDRSVDQLVLKLRRKLAQHGLAERAILSTRGLGYSIPEPGLFDVPRTRILRSPLTETMQTAPRQTGSMPTGSMPTASMTESMHPASMSEIAHLGAGGPQP